MKTDLDTYSKRLDHLMKLKGVPSGNALSKMLLYSSAEIINRLFRDEKNSPSHQLSFDLKKLYKDLNLNWLISNEGEPLLPANKLAAVASFTSEPKPTYKTAYRTNSDGIPLLDVEAAAGRGNEVFNLNNYDIEANYFIPDFEKVDFMLKVRGNSMWPKYNGGDVVACRIIKSLTSIQWNRTYVIAAGDNGILIKRLKRSTIEGNYLLVSDNKDYDPIEMPISEVQGLALVVGTIRLE